MSLNRDNLYCIALLVGISMCTAGLVQSLQAQATPTGELVYAFHVTLSPSWFDPAQTPAQITPFGILYALHDALVRPLPGERMGPALAESWSESPDGTTYTFILRPGLTFHNGDPCTAEDVVFSFARYKGVSAGAFSNSRCALTKRIRPYQRLILTVRGPSVPGFWDDFFIMSSSARG